MLVPVKWLKDFVNIDNISIPELADKLVLKSKRLLIKPI